MTGHHRHDWTPTDTGWTCAECDDTSATCVVVTERRGVHPTGGALLICDPCLRAERFVLDDIADALSHYARPRPSAVQATRYDRDRLTGSKSGDSKPVADQLCDLADILRSWAAMWGESLAESPPDWPVVWLKGRTMWAAHNPDASAWDDYRREIRTLRHDARRLAGLLPKRQAGPCVHCGGEVVQDWADEHWQPRREGLSDILRCTGCQMTWGDRGHWDYVARHTIQLLPESHPDALVTIEHAWAIFPDVPKPTWRKWRERDDRRAEAVRAWAERVAAGEHGPSPEPQRMAVRSWSVRGEPLYLLADLARHADSRAVRTHRHPEALPA